MEYHGYIVVYMHPQLWIGSLVFLYFCYEWRITITSKSCFFPFCGLSKVEDVQGVDHKYMKHHETMICQMVI